MAKRDAVEWLIAPEAVFLCGRLFAEAPIQAQLRLVKLAADDLVRTRCKHWISRIPREETQRDTDCSIPPEFWDDFQQRQHTADWSNATFDAEGQYDPIWGVRKTTVHGVEFCATDLNGYRQSISGGATPAPTTRIVYPTEISRRSSGNITLAELVRRGGPEALLALRSGPEKAAPSLPAAPRKRHHRSTSRNPVTDSEIRMWFNNLPPADQARGYRDLWPMAIRAFRPRKVVRKLVEALATGRGTGPRRV